MTHRRGLGLTLALLLAAVLLAACRPASAPPPPMQSPGAHAGTAAAPGVSAAALTPTLPPGPTPEPTQAIAPSPEPLEPTPLPGNWSLVSLRGDALFVGDAWGAESTQVLSLGDAVSMALRGDQLAYVASGSILLAGLDGSAPRRLADAPPSFLLGPDLIWTGDGQALLTIADREDATATQTGVSIDIGVVTLSDSTWRPGLALADRAGVTVLHAPAAGGQVLLVAWGTEPIFQEVLRYDLSAGKLQAAIPMAGQGEVIPSPDGRFALTSLFDQARGAMTDLLYDLTDSALGLRQRLTLPAGAHSASHVWSPDSRRIAYILRQGHTPAAEGETAGQGLGIWIWDLEGQRTTKVADAYDPAGGPVTWTPDGRYLICRQADPSGAYAYYALDTETGASRRLPLDPASRILGWIPAPAG
ncbi:MAG: hypothetical protein K6V36_11965 [Anaerolineae bacterium]|nr:hypothetical protein [Anaerolineae bacterium]